MRIYEHPVEAEVVVVVDGDVTVRVDYSQVPPAETELAGVPAGWARVD
ncbi:hypothetical protein [Saccharomonospora piscinae]|nr:hypothetical protein [Saccharomonospora piscinae]